MKLHPSSTLLVSAILTPYAAADLGKGRASTGALSYSDVASGADKAFQGLEDYATSNFDLMGYRLKLGVADISSNDTADRVSTTALISVNATRSPPNYVTTFCLVPYVISDQRVQELARTDTGNCSSFMPDKCMDDLRKAGQQLCEGKSAFPPSCNFTGRAYPFKTDMSIANKTAFFAFLGEVHDKANQAAFQEVEMATFPVLFSAIANHTSNFTNSDQTYDWSSGTTRVECLRAGDVSKLSTSTPGSGSATSTTKSGFAAPTAFVSTEKLLGVAAMAAAWGLA